MNKSPKSNKTKAWGLAIGLVAISVVSAHWVAHWFDGRALAALAQGQKQSDPAKAAGWYRLANILSPHDDAIIDDWAQLESKRDDDALAAKIELSYPTAEHLSRAASYQLLAGEDDAALKTAEQLRHKGQNLGPAADLAKSKALFELGQTDEAIKAARAAAGSKTELGQFYAGLYQISVGQTDAAANTIAALGSSEAAQTLKNAQANKQTLAQTLYFYGLLRGSERVLNQNQVESSQFYWLKAVVVLKLGQNSTDSLNQSRDLLQKAVALSPEQVQIRQLLAQIYGRLGDEAAAKDQRAKISALEAGKV